MKKILITGASGFLGSKLSIRLRMHKEYFVETTDRIGDPDILGNLCNKSFVESFSNYDIVIHCAAVQYVTVRKPFFQRKKWFLSNNVDATKNLVSRFDKTDTFFVYIGTSMQYRQDGKDLYEINSDMAPQGIYSLTKLLAQEVVDKASIASATVIPCIIGGQGREGLFKNLIYSIHNWNLAFIPGKGTYKLSLVHVDDIVDLIVLILDKRLEGHFNASSQDAFSISEWVDFIQNSLRIKKIIKIYIPYFPLLFFSKLFDFRILAREQLIMLKMPHVLDIAKTLSIGWKPKFKTQDIIRDISLSITRKNEL
jgi:nucleoside-diphosphate-sugar epimerase